MSKYKKIENTERVSENAKEVIFLDGFKGETLENVISYYLMANSINLTVGDDGLPYPISKESKELESLVNKMNDLIKTVKK